MLALHSVSFFLMLVLDFLNGILALTGEQQLASSAGSLGSLVRNVAQTAINSIAQTVRPQQFELMLQLSTTTQDYGVPVGTIPDNVIQIYNVFWRQGSATPYPYAKLDTQPFEVLDNRVGYAIIGDKLHVSNLLGRDSTYPLVINLHCLMAPVLPTADGADLGIPTLLIPAIQHTAASIMLVSYVDDANAAAQHQRLAETMTAMLRSQVGISRGRQFNLGDRTGL